MSWDRNLAVSKITTKEESVTFLDESAGLSVEKQRRTG